jgi:hypothetical protein
MSIEHEHEHVNPRIDALLRQIVAANDLQPEQNQRVRARLGLNPYLANVQPTITLPVSQLEPIHAPEQEGFPMIATTSSRLRRQWLQFALAAVAFIAVGALLALIFGSGSEDSESQPGVGGSPEATATAMVAATATPSETATSAPATATVADQEPSVVPAPDENGMYRDITLEQAQAIVPFEIVVPERVPVGLEPTGFNLVSSPPLADGSRRYTVQTWFALSGEESSLHHSIQFEQEQNRLTLDMPNAETTTTTINGIAVDRIVGTNAGGDPLLAYTWRDNGVSFMILAALEGDLTSGLVESLVLAILVPPGPTADEQSAILEQERAEMMPFPIPESCAVTGWAGPDFRVRRSESAAYFVDGGGLTLGTTHGVLFAGENEITWLADAPLTTAEALSGPEVIRATRGEEDQLIEIPIDVTSQIDGGIIPNEVERAWWSTVHFPSEGCWEISVSLGAHALDATVYVYARQ